MIDGLLRKLGFMRCESCDHWARRLYWTAGGPQLVCWDCRDRKIVEGFSP